MWDVVTGNKLLTLLGHEFHITGLTYNNDGTTLVSTGMDKSVRIWSTETGEQLKALYGHTDNCTCVAISEDGKILSGSDDCSVLIQETDGRE